MRPLQETDPRVEPTGSLGMPWPAPSLGMATLAALIVAGGLIVLGTLTPVPPIAVVSLAAIPLLLWATVHSPEVVVWVIAFTQIFEIYELQTPVGTLSLSIVALIVFLVPRLPQIAGKLRSPGYRLAAACLAAYVLGQALQLLHGDPGVAVRHMITASSFAAYALFGMSVGARRSLLAAAAVGSAAALLTLAGLAFAANLGVVVVPAPQGPARAIFGVVSPFFRTAGIENHTIGFLLALSVPWLALTLRWSEVLLARAASAVVLALIWLASLLLFQSRSMVLEVPAGMLLALSLANRRFSTGVLLVGTMAGVVVLAGLALAGFADVVSAPQVVSTQLRTESYAIALDEFIHNPSMLLLGANPEQFRLIVNEGLTYGSQIPAAAPIHNLLVETLVSGGIVSAGGLVVLVLGPMLRMFRSAHRVGLFRTSVALAVSAVVIAVLEAAVTPGIANSGLFWMTLGVSVAVAAGASCFSERGSVDSAEQRSSDRGRRPAAIVD